VTAHLPVYIFDAIKQCVARLPEQYRAAATDLLAERFHKHGDDVETIIPLPDGKRLEAHWLRREISGTNYWLGCAKVIEHSSRVCAKESHA
jgi:hypothetical protein